MPDHTDTFDSMMRELVQTEGSRLLEEEKTWKGLVPDEIDKAVFAALGGTAAVAAAAATAAPAVKAAKAAFLAKRIAGAAAGILAAAVLVTGGSYAAIPAFREAADETLAGIGIGPAAHTETVQALTPGGFSIPSPGEGYEITDESTGERVSYKWFTSSENEVLVEVGYRVTEQTGDAAEAVVLGNGAAGTYCEEGNTKTVFLRDGDVNIRVTFSNAEREDVLSYAELLLSANTH